MFRWTDSELAHEPERVKEELALFLERIPGLLSFDDFLPKQHGEVFELRPQKEDALAALANLRAQGKTIALVTHAQGAGKTVTAVRDAKSLGERTLFLAHRRELVQQAYATFGDQWPQMPTGLYLGDVREPNQYNVAGSIQSVARHLADFSPTAGYARIFLPPLPKPRILVDT